MKRLKVLHIISSFVTGGAEKLVVDLLTNHDTNKIEMAAVSFGPKMNYILEKELAEKGIDVYYLNKQKGFDVSIYFKLHKIFREFKPDVVHTHLYVIRYTLLPALINRIPVMVHTIHNNIESKEQNKLGIFVEKIAYHYFGMVPVAISESVRVSIIKTYDMAKNHIPIIINGIDTSKYREVKKCPKNNQSVRLIHIGRLNKQKNHALLIDSFKNVIDGGYDVKLIIVGDGELKEELIEKVNSLGISDKVTFLGIRSDIPELLQASDFFVFSSNWEGLPLVVLEAMSAGLPIVSTKVGGIPEIVQDNVNGVLVEPGNQEMLVEAITKLLTDKQKLVQMGRKSRELASQYDVKQTQQNYEQLYNGLLNEKISLSWSQNEMS